MFKKPKGLGIIVIVASSIGRATTLASMSIALRSNSGELVVLDLHTPEKLELPTLDVSQFMAPIAYVQSESTSVERPAWPMIRARKEACAKHSPAHVSQRSVTLRMATDHRQQRHLEDYWLGQ